jgi:ATP-binding cassette subfamily C (CFTR/MRP) protein 4
MNLASNDVERFLMACLFGSFIFWAPIQSIAILIIGCFILGPAFAAGFGLLVGVFVPLQYYLSGRFTHYRSKIASITDRRVTFVSQAIRGARVMKMSGYEARFLERIQQYRKDEVGQIVKANRLKALVRHELQCPCLLCDITTHIPLFSNFLQNEALFFSTNVVISTVIFVVHVLLGNPVLPGDVFTVFTLINVLQLEMTKHVSLGVMALSEASVSSQRIQKFLEYPELEQRMPDKSPDNTIPFKQYEAETPTDTERLVQTTELSAGDVVSVSADSVLSLRNVTCYWNSVDVVDITEQTKRETELVVALDDISFDVSKGELVAVIGTVGAGKSAFLQAVVGEMFVAKGVVTRNYQSLSYAAQDAWVLDGTIKENILMGLDCDVQWYDKVIKACGLDVDFQQIRYGDMAIVGDRGVQLSGGQRARIGLARAIYRDADLLVADDPLSAVDARVGRQLFNEAILGLVINRGKSVVLATHQHQYLSDCRCLLVTQGKISCDGSYTKCVEASNGRLTAHTSDDAVDNLSGNAIVAEKETTEEDENGKSERGNANDHKEESRQGVVTFETYMEYLHAMGGWPVGIMMFFLYCGTQAAALFTIASIGKWAEKSEETQDDLDIILFVSGLAVLVLLLSLVRAFCALEFAVLASKRLHDKMAEAVLRAKIVFFDTNPLGRILNRFSADVGIADDLLPQTLFDFLVISCIAVGSLVTAVSTLPYALVAIPPLGWFFVSVRNTFVTSTRELKRLEGLARSPIFAMLSEALGGIATIRANDAIKYFKLKFEELHDGHSRAFFSFLSASRWVGFRMDSIVVMFLIVVNYLAVWAEQEGWFSVDPSILGLAISMIIYLAGIFQWCIRQSAEVVNHMVSIERVLGFGKLDSEASWDQPGDAQVLGKGWPNSGAIEYENVLVRYRPSLPPALQNVSFQIPAGSRVGCVGRTGSGKSTVVQTLFRLLEAEQGCIKIDGQDVSQLGLHTLRTHISVIPQVPTLFSGCTVRENLDLFSLHSDSEIESVLKACRLWAAIQDLPLGWDSPVAESGTNFSVGQRQLLCLARALLARNKILVLDEATASVDKRTDELLQEALNETFSDGTIFAVAHRLDTVIESDLILVLGHGQVLEFGSPADLLRTDGGAFASMVADTGETMSADLRRRAFHAKKK